tara:strand:- start:430 stop:636 length:207 start_codon:yes stop_codon:yes gene_type:complete
MRYNVIITDKNGNTFTCAINALSMTHATRKAERIGDLKGIWYKRIQVFNPDTMDACYNHLAFPLFKIK